MIGFVDAKFLNVEPPSEPGVVLYIDDILNQAKINLWQLRCRDKMNLLDRKSVV